MTYRIGIDVGGTFTDLTLWSSSGDVTTFKALSTPGDSSVGVLDGIRLMADAKGQTVEAFIADVVSIVHGTTVTTNAVLTRGGAKTGLITTEGVRDALEMRRGIREEHYDNRYQNVVPLVPRWLRLALPGRLDWRGEEITPLDERAITQAAELLGRAGVEAVAICFMHSYANPAHERAAAELVRAALPKAYVSVSSEVLPTVRFYDRVSTTVLDAYVGPVLCDYIAALTARLDSVAFSGVLLIMQSNGGVALPEITLKAPGTTLLSGPAAGPRAAAEYAGQDCILVDMGGTSFDASLVRNGAAAMNSQGAIDRLRIALPMLDIATIGAGGGSIGWLDDGGLLRMGPKSAGAAPGPACYGRGGELPTCTDADLLLGYLDPDFFAGGKLRLDTIAARAAVQEHIASPLDTTVEEAAAGMYRIINANMAHGVREITVKRGVDPREFPLVVAGGAGALHACEIARDLEIPRVIVPCTASTLCSMGMLLCDLQHDFARSLIGPLDAIDPSVLSRILSELAAEGGAQLESEGALESLHHAALDLRYLKQYHEVQVAIGTVAAAAAALERGELGGFAEAFHAEHDRLYGYNLRREGTGLELINVRVRSLGKTERPKLPRPTEGNADSSAALKGHRRAYIPDKGFAEVAIYDGHRLQSGNSIRGPALIERVDTTVFVGAGWRGRMDVLGSLDLSAPPCGDVI